jgi:hypothetical protein
VVYQAFFRGSPGAISLGILPVKFDIPHLDRAKTLRHLDVTFLILIECERRNPFVVFHGHSLVPEISGLIRVAIC